MNMTKKRQRAVPALQYCVSHDIPLSLLSRLQAMVAQSSNRPQIVIGSQRSARVAKPAA
jgi:hypothetical protein